MKHKTLKLSGVAVAIAAAGLISAYAEDQQSSSAADAASSDTANLAHCYNVNACKGHNDCTTADNACAGQASCKGAGFVAMPTKACNDVGGTVKDEWRGEVSKADLVQCHGVNSCKGHNDCKGADNACAGHAACKGQGFVATTEKSCTDIGGKVGS